MSEFKDTKQAKADDSDSEDEDGKGPALAEETAAAAAPEEDTSLNNPDVVTKYQEAAKITQAVLTSIVAMVSCRIMLRHFVSLSQLYAHDITLYLW